MVHICMQPDMGGILSPTKSRTAGGGENEQADLYGILCPTVNPAFSQQVQP